ncbi:MULTISPECIES: chaperone NapD [Ferrimonas]|uniref:chaperone NapD n=1 Tax=Ferrimonas TaxID=44011 RepID=UPI0003F4DE99|nr:MULTISPECIES: chaperone NapD [Ferrimonas]USD36342.1 chaperone NapD [Ferrimonas sp. SCSIO 43195]
MTEHICSLVVNAVPEARFQVEAALNQLDGVSVEINDPSGKLVVLLQHRQQQPQVECIDHIKGLDGVGATSLIYHQRLSND